MRPLPHLPFTTADDIPQWSNFHNTIVNRPVAALLTPGAAAPPAGTSMASAQAQALNAILQFCMTDPVEPICTIGARWSLSDILSPANVVLDPGTWNQIVAVDDSVLSPAYKAAAKPGRRPVVVQGGTNIRVLNNFLGGFGHLQTKGASDGHRIAGCIATGTHGAHVKVGAVHDTVLGVFLVTGPNQAIFLQPSNRTFLPGMAQAFETNAGIPTQDKPDDDLFNAARVALGGLGFVHFLGDRRDRASLSAQRAHRRPPAAGPGRRQDPRLARHERRLSRPLARLRADHLQSVRRDRTRREGRPARGVRHAPLEEDAQRSFLPRRRRCRPPSRPTLPCLLSALISVGDAALSGSSVASSRRRRRRSIRPAPTNPRSRAPSSGRRTCRRETGEARSSSSIRRTPNAPSVR